MTTPSPTPPHIALLATKAANEIWRHLGEACSTDEAVAIIERALLEVAGARWQPIETAPTKGVIILTDGKKVSPGGWTDCGESEADGWWNVDGDDWEPTHWTPLPAAPDAGKGA